jgi:hypothetical protein
MEIRHQYLAAFGRTRSQDIEELSDNIDGKAGFPIVVRPIQEAPRYRCAIGDSLFQHELSVRISQFPFNSAQVIEVLRTVFYLCDVSRRLIRELTIHLAIRQRKADLRELIISKPLQNN